MVMIDIEPAQVTTEDYEVIVSLLSDVGCHREINEDFARFVTTNDDERLASRGILAVLADGMGGHSAGEVASRMAVETIINSYYELGASADEALKLAFQKANDRIYRAASKDPQMNGMGTTCTALALKNNLAMCAQVGDSRLYLVRGQNIYLMSDDHSAVMQLVKLGVINREMANHHPDKNVLLRAMGTAPEVEVAMWQNPFPVRADDYFVLCSDGLYDLVSDEEIKQVVLSCDPHLATETLINLAKERGGYDNITVGVVSLRPTSLMEISEMRETREMKAVKVEVST